MDPIEDWRKTHYTSEITPKLDGTEITLAGWLRDIRLHGNIAFLIVADREGDCQVTVLKKEKPELFDKAKTLNREDALILKGKIQKTDMTNRGVELILSDLKLLNKSKTPLPLDPMEKVPAELDTRLDARVLDLRKPRVSAIFKIRAQILKSAREYFTENKFIEIQTPNIIATATEGGAALFPVSYFDREAFLRQSPQIYKELMTACFERVFEIGQVYRAEPSDTPRHIAEVTQMDIEMGFATEEDTWKILDGVIPRIYEDVKENCKRELELLDQNDLQVPKAPFPRVSYTDMLKKLEKKGLKLKWGEDIPPDGERMITDMYKNYVIVYDYPMEMKPYYIHPHEDDEKISYGFDLIGEYIEIASGGRRIHDPKLYEDMIKKKGMNPEAFRSVINFYELGMPNHAGWAIGVDRLTMVMCGLKNVRESILFPRDIKRLTP